MCIIIIVYVNGLKHYIYMYCYPFSVVYANKVREIYAIQAIAPQ